MEAPSLITRDTTMRRPSTANGIASSPVSPGSASFKQFIRSKDMNLLTPPTSPPRGAGSPSDLFIRYEHLDTLRSSVDSSRPFSYTPDNIISCPFEVEYVCDLNNQRQKFGFGAWSNVFKATCCVKQSLDNGLMTPPSHHSAELPLLVAVKSPARKDAVAILRNEGRILSKLRECDPNENYVVAFHGMIEQENSLVLSAHPLSLENHIRACIVCPQSANQNGSAISPVVGSASIWLDLADKLVSALDWMHNEARVVHGDIKPGNILLRPIAASLTGGKFCYEPLFVDFSSSQQLDVAEPTLNTLSAVTMEYTAPELLKSSVLRDPRSCATTASDVFSMAVTLLVAATGDLMVYTGCSSMQRQFLATSGSSILNNVRSFSTRISRHGIVSRTLERAVLKHDMGRISARSWKQTIDDIKATQDPQPRI